ncbi:hypothetical protein HD554DRAFT_2179102 [Boletus coccyginus]|nr:hypothetical protein HD554DRAFT_2179102 [Boletus coccyginus]
MFQGEEDPIILPPTRELSGHLKQKRHLPKDPTELPPAKWHIITALSEFSGYLKRKRDLPEDAAELPPAKRSFFPAPEIVSGGEDPTISSTARLPSVQELSRYLKQKRNLPKDSAELPPTKQSLFARWKIVSSPQHLIGAPKRKRPLPEDPTELPPAKQPFIAALLVSSSTPPLKSLMQWVQEFSGYLKRKRALPKDPTKLPVEYSIDSSGSTSTYRAWGLVQHHPQSTLDLSGASDRSDLAPTRPVDLIVFLDDAVCSDGGNSRWVTWDDWEMVWMAQLATSF